jgi:hypothetical protein
MRHPRRRPADWATIPEAVYVLLAAGPTHLEMDMVSGGEDPIEPVIDPAALAALWAQYRNRVIAESRRRGRTGPTWAEVELGLVR